MSDESMQDFLKYVVQVKIEGFGSRKYQFRVSFNPEIMDEPGLFDDAIYFRSARMAKENRDSGVWPKDGAVMVWYAHVDDDMNIISEKEWHEVEAKYLERAK